MQKLTILVKNTDSDKQGRFLRAAVIAREEKNCIAVQDQPGYFYVKSQAKAKKGLRYKCHVVLGCECEDYFRRGIECKHMLALMIKEANKL